MHHRALVQTEGAHRTTEGLGLLLHRLGRRRRLLHQRRILLRHLVHLRDRLVHLLDARTLLLARRRDLGHDVGHPLDRTDDLLHRLARLVHQLGARVNLLHRVAYQRLDFLGRSRTPLRQVAHLGGHHRKAPTLLAGPRRLDRRVEREDVGLEGDAIDDADDVHDLLRGLVDRAHGIDHLPDHLPALDRHLGS